MATITAVNDELRKLPSLVSVDDEDDDASSTGKLIAAGRSFDRERMTVMNSKSAADWVELKDQVEYQHTVSMNSLFRFLPTFLPSFLPSCTNNVFFFYFCHRNLLKLKVVLVLRTMMPHLLLRRDDVDDVLVNQVFA